MDSSLNERLNAAFAAAGAVAWGGVDFAAVEPLMDPQAREKTRSLCPDARTVLTAAFPYFTGETAGNLSVYARGRDYHLVLGAQLNTICDFLRTEYSSHSFLSGVDASPLPERECAWRSGLGLRGRSGMFILPPYGSYVFLGTILTGLAMDFPPVEPAPPCIDCGRCVAACPSGALEHEMFQVKRCLSDLTQRKGELTAEEIQALKAHPYVWGCDICQNVCPYNAGALAAPLGDFLDGYTADLTSGMVDGLTNRTFRARYGDRAFAWRGPAVLKRNLDLKKE